ncbi:kinase-like domain-containing protein [Cyathus striatus]|nr:kinase-like domain-containing protein [Cyathus striatus]
MAPKQPCAKYQYVVTATGPKILPVDEPCKDEESPADYNAGGYLQVKVNDTFKGGKYRVIRKLGWGHFSTVWLVKDTQTKGHSALKVVKSAGRYAETARDEIKLLSRVQSFAPSHPGRSYIVSFLDSFSHQTLDASHVCIVFEPLGEHLLALIERHKKKGVPRALVRVIAKQILLGLQYLHDECDLVHTDIKPENILISIPDIEAHIQNELSQSPSPTSRRVGVPLPTKSRAGVTIPYNQQRARRQVQIFDSQPLASPGRSFGGGATSHPMSINGRPVQTGSGNSSNSGSFIAHLQQSKLAAAGPSSGSMNFASGTVSSLSSSAPKPSSLSIPSSVPNLDHEFRDNVLKPSNKSISVMPTHPPQSNSPSTSSSSSSISSALVYLAASSSSTISTPPTSLPLSLSNAMTAFVGKVKASGNSPASEDRDISNDEGQERISLPMGIKGKGKMPLDAGDTTSSSWKLQLTAPASWKDIISSSISSSFKSTNSRNSKSQASKSSAATHEQLCSQSGVSGTSFWKDPGTAPPAPAVVVSANAGADHNSTDFFELTRINIVPTPGSTISETSSGAATITRPSPTTTPLPDSNKSKPTSLLSGAFGPVFRRLQGSLSTVPPDSNSFSHKTCPSLLTQTAPSRSAVTSESQRIMRESPPQHVSQLSAHMHLHHPSSLCQCSDSTHKHRTISRGHTKPSASRTTNYPSATYASPTSVTPTPTPLPPAAPPPTPIVSPSTFDLIPLVASSELPCTTSNLPPIQTDIHSPPPPISIKIADLGNATPSKKHYTEDIQTRQYRAPEAILGRRDWDARADIWSVACVVFELLTAEYLFDPQGQGELFTKDDDHMAQIIELLGDFPMEVKMGGKYSRELFDHTGALRYIPTLKPWPLKRVMIEKYLFSETEATELCHFLEPMLAIDMHERVNAKDMINHPWLQASNDDPDVTEW